MNSSRGPVWRLLDPLLDGKKTRLIVTVQCIEKTREYTVVQVIYFQKVAFRAFHEAGPDFLVGIGVLNIC